MAATETRRRTTARRNGGAAPPRPRLSPSERAAKGKALRSEVPRASHAEWTAPEKRPDPVALLEEQASTRVPELVPIRYGRMVASPFAFYRGAAYVMASDLSTTPATGIRVQLCGDAHLSNFGAFASPERDLLFDLNDFDETLPGPWEWDVKRLAASLAVAARANGIGAKRRSSLVRGAVAEYRQAIRRFAGMTTLEVWYSRLDAADVTAMVREQGTRKQAKRFDRNVAKARRKDSTRAFEKLAYRANGDARIVSDPPLIVPVSELVPESEASQLVDGMRSLIRGYRASLPNDRCRLLDGYEFADLARKVVGVGSVGTRAWVILLLGQNADDPLFLQAKEAGPSVLERFAGKSQYANQGRRVVEGQRLMQASSDIFLGWLRTIGVDEQERDFYIRQLWDWKGSAEIEQMQPDGLAAYARLCAWTLARAHARSGDSIAIGAYLGSGDKFDVAIAGFAEAYADQNERDHQALAAAIDSGRLAAEAGI